MAHAGHSVDEYLETIYFLAFPIGEYKPLTGGTSPTLASRVAEMLGVSRASAGEMLKRMESEGLISRGENKEAVLTKTGRARAEKVVRKHRLIERLLTDFMDYTPAEAHIHADEIGDSFSDDMVERMAQEARESRALPARLAGRSRVRAGGERRAEGARGAGRGAGGDHRPARGARRGAPPLVLRPGVRARPRAAADRRGPRRRKLSRSAERPRGDRRGEGGRGALRQAFVAASSRASAAASSSPRFLARAMRAACFVMGLNVRRRPDVPAWRGRPSATARRAVAFVPRV